MINEQNTKGHGVESVARECEKIIKNQDLGEVNELLKFALYISSELIAIYQHGTKDNILTIDKHLMENLSAIKDIVDFLRVNEDETNMFN